MTYQCQFCKKNFVKESTLTSHSCERKRRFQQQAEIGVQWGFRAYLIFYETTQGKAKKTYEQFVDSAYYTAFVRFGRYCHAVHCINYPNYTRWLLRNNRKLDEWCRESNYQEWLIDYLRRENVQDALERSIKNMLDYMAEHPEYKNGYQDYFRLVNENRICYHITTGRISAWAVYHCNTGKEFLERLNDDQIASVIEFVHPDFWRVKFKDHPADVDFVAGILSKAGL